MVDWLLVFYGGLVRWFLWFRKGCLRLVGPAVDEVRAVAELAVLDLVGAVVKE